MTDKVIYDDDGTRAELDTDLDVIVLTSQPFWKKENTLLLTVKEIDAIHAAIHADDEPEAVEADCCGNCDAMPKVCYLSTGPTGYCHHYRTKE